MLSCDICRVIFSYSKMSISTCMREQASSSWRSKMFSLLIQEFTRAQWWTALGRHLCLQSSPFKVQQFAGERKVNHRHSVQMSLVVFPIFARNIHFFPLSSLSVSLSLFIKWRCNSLEHATTGNIVLVHWEKKAVQVLCNRFLQKHLFTFTVTLTSVFWTLACFSANETWHLL